MALTVEKSMDVADFWESWRHIAALVELEYQAVEGMVGSYEFKLELIWDCEEADDDLELD